jgi:hypothetical protein
MAPARSCCLRCDRLDTEGRHACIIEGPNIEAERLIARYREHNESLPERKTRVTSPLARIGMGAMAVVTLGGIGCQLRRPTTVPSRMIEPQLLDPQLTDSVKQAAKSTNATPIRLFDTRARGHIGRRVLHRLPNGELTEDAVWL